MDITESEKKMFGELLDRLGLKNAGCDDFEVEDNQGNREMIFIKIFALYVFFCGIFALVTGGSDY